MYKTPELLCPAGDMAALEAAIMGGADAVYFGGTDFNARKNAANFDAAGLREAVKTAHAYGLKAYVTQNTLCFDREIVAYLSAAESAINAGADALIVADMGGAALIKKHFPKAELHASTQMSGHNTAAARLLSKLGFSRMVLAREMQEKDIAEFCKSSPIEAEVFVHGALCVCHSGQCLFSSIVGGRSGNRGECAQPCRLPYSGGYPLSLKDSSLAMHIKELSKMGVASLKIEGRMKSAEYVRDVSTIYRRLLDQRRNADESEIKELAEIFSRGGLTDGYYRGKIGSPMLGVRREEDKASTRALEPFEGLTKKIPLKIKAVIKREQNCTITLTSPSGSLTHTIDAVPFEAQNAPLDKESVAKQLLKLGSTPFECDNADIELDEGIMLPLSVLNRLRREAVDRLLSADLHEKPVHLQGYSPEVIKKEALHIKTATFRDPLQIPKDAKDFFDIIFLPLHKYDGSTNGVALPSVIFDSELIKVEKMLAEAKEKGAEYALVGNIGHLELAKKYNFRLCGDIRLNITNSQSGALAKALGFELFAVSPELSLPRARDIGGISSVTVYGRLPLMLLEKCVGKELGSCQKCQNGEIFLKDRKGVTFPVLREWEHRSVIYNSLPTSMSDKKELLIKHSVTAMNFIFSTESKEECARVITAFKKGLPIGGQVRRI